MKKILVLILLSSCENWTKQPFIVTSITTNGIYMDQGKYMLTINKSDIHLYTDKKYNIGDTIK